MHFHLASGGIYKAGKARQSMRTVTWQLLKFPLGWYSMNTLRLCMCMYVHMQSVAPLWPRSICTKRSGLMAIRWYATRSIRGNANFSRNVVCSHTLMNQRLLLSPLTRPEYGVHEVESSDAGSTKQIPASCNNTPVERTGRFALTGDWLSSLLRRFCPSNSHLPINLPGLCSERPI